jgi:hypothetical protein
MFGLSGNLFILRASRNLPEDVEKRRLLLSAAIINMTFSTLLLILPRMTVSSPTETERLILAGYTIFLGLISSLPSFITMGIFFFIFGKTNRERYNIFVMLAGILWIISQGFVVAFLSGNLWSVISLFVYSPPEIMQLYLLTTILYLVVWIVILSGYILLMIHGIKNDDSNLKIAGILGVINMLFVIVYYLFISITPGLV